MPAAVRALRHLADRRRPTRRRRRQVEQVGVLDLVQPLGGRIDILVNNAGVYPVTLTEDLPDADLDAMLAINIRAPHVLVGEIAPVMAGCGRGAIVDIGSWMAQVGNPSARCTRPRRPPTSN
ncbi:NAD(P)-dependent dehydrogenase (short-subunit alcohol dehydrogenase family) [Nakamurella sp. UYEF19]